LQYLIQKIKIKIKIMHLVLIRFDPILKEEYEIRSNPDNFHKKALNHIPFYMIFHFF